MANVLFKRGHSNSLPSGNNIDIGTFYYTYDTDRLYLGDEKQINGTTEKTLVLLNQTVEIINSQKFEDLKREMDTNSSYAKHKNEFYYISDQNILCIYDGTRWSQINPNTNDQITGVAVTANAQNHVATATITISGADEMDPEDSTKQFSESGSFTITGAGSVDATASGSNITLTGATYTLATPAASDTETDRININLNSSDANLNSSISLHSTDDTALKFKATATGIDLIASDTTVSTVAVSAGTVANGDAGSLTVTITDSNGTQKSGTKSNLGMALVSANGGSGGYLPIIDAGVGAVAGEVYSKAAIDDLFAGLDGMTYKGSVGLGNTLPSSGVKNGDTYVVVQDGFTPSSTDTIEASTGALLNGNSTKVGDMFIAKGTENDGEITSATLEWTYIPAGNDSLGDVTYHGVGVSSATENSLSLVNENDDIKSKIDLRGGTNIEISSTITDAPGSTTGNILTAEINHESISTTDNTTVTSTKLPSENNAVLTDGGASFAAITGLTLDNGHITAIERGKFVPVTYKLLDPTLTQVSQVNGVTNNGTSTVNVAVNIGDSNDNIFDSSSPNVLSPSNIKFKSDTIKMTADVDENSKPQVTMNFEWGTF